MTLRIGRAIAFLFGTVMALSIAGPVSAAAPGKAFGAIAPATGTQADHARSSSSNIIKVQDRQWRGGQQRARRGQQQRRVRREGRRGNVQRRQFRRGNVQRRQFRRAQNLNQRNRQLNRRAYRLNRRANQVNRRANRVNRRAYRVNRRAARVNRGWRGQNYRRGNLRWRNRAAWNRRHNIWRRYPRPPRWGRPGPGVRPWRYWRGHRYYWYRDGWWPYAWLGGVVVLPSTTYYYSDPAPAPVYGPAPWTPEWYAYCSSKYRTFNPRTGYYYYQPGRQRFCR